MANIQQILSYLGKHCRFTTLPSYDGLREGLEVDEAACEGVESQFVIPMKFSKSLKEKKLGEVKKIASHLWGGNEDVRRVFHKIDGVAFHDFYYGRTCPLRVKVFFSNDFEKTFYAKILDEKRLFGIELENMLSPYKYEYSASGGGIYEDEVPGIEQSRINSDTKRDNAYLEELAKLDYRAFVMLLGDLNPNENPHNCLVTKEFSGDSYTYNVRPIDFDGLFEIKDFQRDLVLSGRREEAANSIGKDRYHILRSFEKESMRKKYCQYYERINELLDIVGSSDTCNREVRRLGGLLDEYYRDQNADFKNSKNMGDLFGKHIRLQIVDSK